MRSVRVLMIRGSFLLTAYLVLFMFLFWWSVHPTKKVLFYISNLEEISGWNSNSRSLTFRRTLSNNKPIKSSENDPPEKIPTLLVTSDKNPKISLRKQHDFLPLTGEQEKEYQKPPREVQESAGAPEQPPMVVAPLAEDGPDPPLDSLERKMYSDLRDCPTRPLRPHSTQRGGDYWILNNYIPAAMNFRCDESITYATHGDYTFLDNLGPLTSRWQGPVSVAVYAPSTDFTATIDTILYLRNCMAEGIKKYVTFHLFFPFAHVPRVIPTTDQLLQRKTNCDKDTPKWSKVTTYRRINKLEYPVNVARNTARENSQTYFNIVSDVELYPSINVIPEFFKMLKRPDASISSDPRVFVFPIFEVYENCNVPETKAELQAMLKNKSAIPFHKHVCEDCHNQPKSNEWQEATAKADLDVFYVGKRHHSYYMWEPIFIGTGREPIYDERLSWEGMSDKMTQMHILCVRDYEFHILDTSFLVHKPGIKTSNKDPTRDKFVAKQNNLIRNKIIHEYKILFGSRKGCAMV